MAHARRAALLLALALPGVTVIAPAPAAAQGAPVDGTYILDGGGYRIEVKQVGDTLEVKEPNRDSVYVRQPDGSYLADSETLGQRYGLRIVDDTTIEAFKPVPGNVPTRLRRLGPVPTIRTVDIPPSVSEPATTARATATATAGNADGAIADRYLALTRSDPKNVQTWAFCSAAALKRATATAAEADAYGREAAAALRGIAIDPARSPCEDAIPAALWSGAAAVAAPAVVRDISTDEEERLRQLNLAADARARAELDRRNADLALQAERDAAYQEGQAQYMRERAEYEAAMAAAKAADDDYRRQMEAHRKLLDSGNYRRPD